MSSEGEAEAAAESGPGSTPAPGAAAAGREEVSGCGMPAPSRAGPGRGETDGVRGCAGRSGEPLLEDGVPPCAGVGGCLRSSGEPRSQPQPAWLPAASRQGQPPASAERCAVLGAVPGRSPRPRGRFEPPKPAKWLQLRGSTCVPPALHRLLASGRRLGRQLCSVTMQWEEGGPGRWDFG